MSNDKVFINHAIKFPRVLCIDHTNTNLGIITTSLALSIAQSQNLDLVQVAGPNKEKIPTCKILNYGKYKYDLSKKKKEAEKKQKEASVKDREIKFRPTTDLNDLKIKARKAEEFLVEGARVKITIKFKGREITHKEVGMETLTQFLALLPTAKTLGAPSLDEKHIWVILVAGDI